MAFDNTTTESLWEFLFVDLADRRTHDWFLMTSPVPFLFILVAYLIFVLKLGPKFMRNRKPYELKRTLIVYNFFQVLVSAYIFSQGLLVWLRYNWKCQPVDFSNSPFALMTARTVHLYFLAKMTELLDTVFFVLRKKDGQISFLHVYHHSVMPIVSWGATKYYPGGHGTFVGVVNSFVHILMYSYYLVAALGPRFRTGLWWKRYITDLQMIQFCVTFLHNSQLIFYDCGYPRWSAFLSLPTSVFFYYLFNDFYRKSYGNEKVKQNGDYRKLE